MLYISVDILSVKKKKKIKDLRQAFLALSDINNKKRLDNNLLQDKQKYKSTTPPGGSVGDMSRM